MFCWILSLSYFFWDCVCAVSSRDFLFIHHCFILRLCSQRYWQHHTTQFGLICDFLFVCDVSLTGYYVPYAASSVCSLVCTWSIVMGASTCVTPINSEFSITHHLSILWMPSYCNTNVTSISSIIDFLVFEIFQIWCPLLVEVVLLDTWMV